MKKQYLTAVVVALSLAVLLPACSHEEEDDNGEVTLVGTWDATTATLTSPELPAPLTLTSSLGMLEASITFNADGTFSMSLSVPLISFSDSFSGTWSASSSELKIVSGGERGEGSYELQGRTLVVTYSRDGNHIVISASKR